MKPKLSAYLSAALLSLLISLGAVFCPVTAFHLACSRGLLALGCLLFSLLFPLLFFSKRPKLVWIPFWILVFCAGYLLFSELLSHSLYLVQAIYDQYCIAYILPFTLQFGENVGDSATIALLFFGFFTALCVSFTVLRRQNSFSVCALCLVAFVPCVIDPKSFPSTASAFLLLGGFLLLILSQSARRHGTNDGLPLALCLPVAALLMILFVFCPRHNYQRSAWSDSLQGKAIDTLAQLPFLTEKNGELLFTPVPLSSLFESSAVNLRSIGPKSLTGQVVMSVRSSQGGTLYLRGAALGDYTGSVWKTVDQTACNNAGVANWEPGPMWDGDAQTLDVHTSVASKVIYTPYGVTVGSDPGNTLYDIYMVNRENTLSYSVSYRSLDWNARTPVSSLAFLQYMQTYQAASYQDLAYWSSELLPSTSFHYASMLEWEEENRAYIDFVSQYYTTLPDKTRSALEAIIQEEGLDQPPVTGVSLPEQAAKAFAVANYVRKSARYDLNTPHMPYGKDFVLWFLQDSDTGYCVHYASATVALLRAMGIPARYVTGYMVSAEPEQWFTITTDDAHAWAEFFLPGFGWVPLESTGSSDFPPETEPMTVPTEATLPDMVPDTLPTKASQPAPSEAAPAQTAAATEPAPSSPSGPASSGIADPGANASGSSVSFTPILWRVLLGLLIAAFPFAYRYGMLFLRRKRLQAGSPTKQALSQYFFLRHMAKVSRIFFPPELRSLAQKAKFSRDGLAPEELEPFREFYRQAVRQLRKKPWYCRFLNYWIFVLY